MTTHYTESGVRIVKSARLDLHGLGILAILINPPTIDPAFTNILDTYKPNEEEANGHRFSTKAERKIDTFK